VPGTPQPVGRNGPFGPFWIATFTAIRNTNQQVNALTAGAQATNVTDQYGNTIQVTGPSLNQVVTIGASHGVAGVQVWTGIAAGTAGIAVQSGPATTKINLTKGSYSATLASGVTGAALTVGQVIGAANVSDPSSGVATAALTPGTTITAVSGQTSGSTVTLSLEAAESGSDLACAPARFVVLQDSGFEPLTLTSGWSPTAGYYTPSVRLISDRAYFSGAISSGGTVPPDQFTTLATAFQPTADIAMVIATVDGAAFNTLTIAAAPSGAVSLSSPPSNETFCLDSLSYRLI
jgi:hypothetical protein